MSDEMIKNSPPQVLIIDDQERSARSNIDLLQRAAAREAPTAKIEFVLVNPKDVSGIQGYPSIIDTLPAAAVIIDYRFEVGSGANYTGLQLAIALRELYSKLPIFILTQYAPEYALEEKGFAVEDVMDKGQLADHPETYVGRILRAAGLSEEARTESSKRMQNLINTSLHRELTASEEEELIALRQAIGINTFGELAELSNQTRTHLRTEEEILEILKKYVGEE